MADNPDGFSPSADFSPRITIPAAAARACAYIYHTGVTTRGALPARCGIHKRPPWPCARLLWNFALRACPSPTPATTPAMPLLPSHCLLPTLPSSTYYLSSLVPSGTDWNCLPHTAALGAGTDSIATTTAFMGSCTPACLPTYHPLPFPGTFWHLAAFCACFPLSGTGEGIPFIYACLFPMLGKLPSCPLVVPWQKLPLPYLPGRWDPSPSYHTLGDSAGRQAWAWATVPRWECPHTHDFGNHCLPPLPACLPPGLQPARDIQNGNDQKRPPLTIPIRGHPGEALLYLLSLLLSHLSHLIPSAP